MSTEEETQIIKKIEIHQKHLIDFHLTVCKYHTIDHPHGLADRIESDIDTLFNEANILKHYEPCLEVCEGCQKSCKALIRG